MSERSKHLFEFMASDISAAAKSEAEYHATRLAFWQGWVTARHFPEVQGWIINSASGTWQAQFWFPLPPIPSEASR